MTPLFYRYFLLGGNLFGLDSGFLGSDPLFGCLQDKLQHPGIGQVGKLRHLCQMSVPAPARVGVYLKELRAALTIKPPVKAGIIPAFQPFE